jgi:hypothetical protein
MDMAKDGSVSAATTVSGARRRGRRDFMGREVAERDAVSKCWRFLPPDN